MKELNINKIKGTFPYSVTIVEKVNKLVKLVNKLVRKNNSLFADIVGLRDEIRKEIELQYLKGNFSVMKSENFVRRLNNIIKKHINNKQNDC